MAWTNPKTWVVGEIMSAADLNTYVRDNENAIGALTTFTPTWTGSVTNPTIGNGTLTGRYLAVGDWVQVWMVVVAGSTTTYGSGNYSLSLPFASAATYEQFLDGAIYNNGISRLRGVGLISPASSSLLLYEPPTWVVGAAPSIWTPTSPFTFGSTDTATVWGWYRR